jgi:hypothetical protein
MSGWNEELLAGLSTAPWHPRSLRPPARDSLPRRLRLGVLAAIALLHVLGALLLIALVERNRTPPPDDAILVDFIDAAPEPPTPLANETITIRMPSPTPTLAPKPALAPQPRPRPRVRTDVPLQAVDARRPLPLYNPDGRLRVPEDMLDQLDRKFGDKRQFSYQIPHLDDGKKLLERPPALVYEETRFDQYWKPRKDLLSEILEKAVEKTIREVKIKVPGTNSYVVCKVSILAMGGACGMITPGSDWNGPQDDPATLNPEEARQCAAWWEQIVGAKTQDVWRGTKQLYERECRKPLLRTPSG